MLSLVIPVYRNEANIPALLDAMERLAGQLDLEVVFVVDGSPDRSAAVLERELPRRRLRCQLIQLSRNFGSFAAITAGLANGRGEYFSMLAADLQEPPELILQFHDRLRSGEVDIVIGQRLSRQDPPLSPLFSALFWRLFRSFAVADIPEGGVDTFGCTRQVRDRLIALEEVDSSLVSLLFWLGYRREMIQFTRREREIGKSAWTWRKKLDYAIHSFFNFTDLPIRFLLAAGFVSSVLALLFGLIVVVARLNHWIQVPGYSMLAIAIAFFGGITTFGLGVVGQYVWLALQNARRRPNYIVRTTVSFPGADPE